MIYLTEVPNADTDDPADAIVAIQVVGTLEKKDGELLGPRLDDLIQQHGKVRLLIELVDFHGWTAGAAWEDVKLAYRHFSDIERIAVVGDKRWEKGMTVLATPFTGAQVRYFDVEERAAANAWVRKRDETSPSAKAS